MKIQLPSHPARRQIPARRHGERGSLVIVLMILLAMMLIYVNANVRTLDALKSEIKVVEKQQLRRLAKAGIATNAVPTTAPSASTNAPTPP